MSGASAQKFVHYAMFFIFVLLHLSPAFASETQPLKDPILFQTSWGTGPYDRWEYRVYDSALWFSPEKTMEISFVTPKIFSCDGQCTFTLTIEDARHRTLVSITERHAKPKAFTGMLPKTVTLKNGERYRLELSVSSSKSKVGIYTAGSASFPNRRGPAVLELIEARSGTRPYTERGFPTFTLRGRFPIEGQE